jgi:hypothetical protein
VVKDPTQPDPSLVTEVEDSSLTILHQIYSASGEFYISHWYREREGAPLRVSSKGGHICGARLVRSSEGEGVLEISVVGFSLQRP